MTQPKSFTRTRIAPTPSGYLHLGNIFSFALTTQLAAQYGARVLLRIDDLDRQRADEKYIRDIFETLRFLQLHWDEGPSDEKVFTNTFSQYTRMHLYNEALDKLRRHDQVFACTCSRSEILEKSSDGAYPGTCRHKKIPLDTPNVNWRLKTETERRLQLKTLDGKTREVTLPASMQYFVVRKKDGYPAYQLASVVDDVHFNVDLIVRGLDLWESSIAQLYLASVLEAENFLRSTFHHHPLLTDGDLKMSKSAGAVSIHYLRQHGVQPGDIYAAIERQKKISR
jgi:glutamyl-tRNA synthetase